jgi:hypothetical protein
VEGSALDRGSSKACLQRYRRVRGLCSAMDLGWAPSSCILHSIVAKLTTLCTSMHGPKRSRLQPVSTAHLCAAFSSVPHSAAYHAAVCMDAFRAPLQ